MPELDALALRTAFGRYLTGVTVVTARALDGRPVGFTGNSFTSVSLEPPLLLVCPGRHMSSYQAFAETEHFAVSILAEGQEAVANAFAGRRGDRFADTDWTADERGCALIAGRAAGFSCAVEQRLPAGDHIVLLGRITAFDQAEVRGLGYLDGGYFALGKERQAEAAAPPGTSTRASIILEADGHVLLTPAHTLPAVPLRDRRGARQSLAEHLQMLGVTATLGPVFAIYDDSGEGVHHIVLRGHARGRNETTPLTAVPLAALAELHTVSAAEASMLRRFAREHETRNFGLYIGDAERGEVHVDQGS